MMQSQGLIKELILGLCCLPGVGPKSAQRMAFHLLQRNRQGGLQLSQVLARAMEGIGYCQMCRIYSEHAVCEECANSLRDSGLLCVVESAADVWIIDQVTTFKGLYFVLHGHLSPLDGIGPDQLGFDVLEQRIIDERVREVIVATSSTVEGQATAQFISEIASKHGKQVSRIAHGVPIGGELEYIDGVTLMHAFEGRRAIG